MSSKRRTPSKRNTPAGSAEPSESASDNLIAVGDPPGSASYFGYYDDPSRHQMIPGAEHAHEGIEPSVGDPPGSPSYYGASEPAGADFRDISAVGDPPGSPAYFGYTFPEAQVAATGESAKEQEMGPTSAQATVQRAPAGPIHGHLMGHGPAGP